MTSTLLDALALGASYALIAVGYTLVYGIIKLAVCRTLQVLRYVISYGHYEHKVHNG